MKDSGYAGDLIKILWMSQGLPESVLCCRSDMDEHLRQKIIDALQFNPSSAIGIAFQPFDVSYYEEIERIPYSSESIDFE